MALLRSVCIAIAAAMLLSGTAFAEVRFGKNVRIGGHDFSNRAYKGVRIERTSKRPPWYGCRIFRAGAVHEGKRLRERTEICYLKSIPPHKRRKVQ